MARYRTYKPEYFTDAKVGRLSIPARLLFLAILPHADDRSGVFDARPTVIRAASFPGDRISDARILKMLAEIEATGMIRTFISEGLPFGWVVNFAKHQRVEKPGPQRFPDPPFGEESPKPPRSLPEASPKPPASRARVVSGKESKGEELESLAAGAAGEVADDSSKKARPEDPDAWRSRTPADVLELIDVLRREVSRHNPDPRWEKPNAKEAISGRALVALCAAGKVPGAPPGRSKERLLWAIHAAAASDLWRGKLWTLATVEKNLNQIIAQSQKDWDTFKDDTDPFEVFRNE